MNEIKRLKIIVMGHEKRLAILEGRLSSKESDSTSDPKINEDKTCTADEQSRTKDEKL